MERVERRMEGINTRRNDEKVYKEKGTAKLQMDSFVGDATRLWNRAPRGIKNAKTMISAKKEIKLYCKSLPI